MPLQNDVFRNGTQKAPAKFVFSVFSLQRGAQIQKAPFVQLLQEALTKVSQSSADLDHIYKFKKIDGKAATHGAVACSTELLFYNLNWGDVFRIGLAIVGSSALCIESLS